MKFTMTTPCASCPFREDVTFYLHPQRTREILTALLEHDQTFTCHKTLHSEGWDEDEEHYAHTGDEQHCAGALIMAERLSKPPQLARIAERLRLYDHTKLDMAAPVFATPQAMVERMEKLNTRGSH